MTKRRQLIPAAGLLTTMAAAIYMVIQLSAQAPTALVGDYANATIAEVRDSQGQIVLRGQFAPAADEDDDESERKARLQATGVDTDAAGEAEVEIPKAAGANQEVEFSIHNVQSGATYTFVIDGNDVATATADAEGEAEVELEMKPAKAAARR